jgi:hypothetical protein
MLFGSSKRQVQGRLLSCGDQVCCLPCYSLSTVQTPVPLFNVCSGLPVVTLPRATQLSCVLPEISCCTCAGPACTVYICTMPYVSVTKHLGMCSCSTCSSTAAGCSACSGGAG